MWFLFEKQDVIPEFLCASVQLLLSSKGRNLSAVSFSRGKHWLPFWTDVVFFVLKEEQKRWNSSENVRVSHEVRLA